MSVHELYRSAILDHNRHPRNVGRLPDATHSARGLNALCGDDIQVDVRLGEGGVIEAVRFEGEAGAITLSSASMMTEHVRGRSIAEVIASKSALECLLRAATVSESLRAELGELAALEGVRPYPSRIRAALLPWEALQAALDGVAVASTE